MLSGTCPEWQNCVQYQGGTSPRPSIAKPGGVRLCLAMPSGTAGQQLGWRLGASAYPKCRPDRSSSGSQLKAGNSDGDTPAEDRERERSLSESADTTRGATHNRTSRHDNGYTGGYAVNLPFTNLRSNHMHSEPKYVTVGCCPGHEGKNRSPTPHRSGGIAGGQRSKRHA